MICPKVSNNNKQNELVSQPFIIFHFLLLFICMSCDDSRHIRYFQIEKKSVPNIVNQKLAISNDISWTPPSNWIVSQGSSMRIGSFTIPYSNAEGDLSIIKLDGTAGGLKPNINRWRRQLNLEAHSEDRRF